MYDEFYYLIFHYDKSSCWKLAEKLIFSRGWNTSDPSQNWRPFGAITSDNNKINRINWTSISVVAKTWQ